MLGVTVNQALVKGDANHTAVTLAKSAYGVGSGPVRTKLKHMQLGCLCEETSFYMFKKF